MIVYSAMSLLTIIFGFIFNTVGERNKRNFSAFGLFLVLVVWTTIYAMRFEIGSDYYGYVRDYFRASSFSYSTYIDDYRDVGFYSVAWVANRLFNNEWIFYNILLGVLTYLPVLIVISKKSEYFISSCLLFIFTMTFFSGFNGVRQTIAVSFVFYAYYIYFGEKKYIKYLLLILIAFTFHSTALIVIPFHLISKVRVKSKTYLFFVVIMLISYLFLFDLWENVINILEGMGQEKLAADYADISKDRGSSFLRFAVAVLPVAFCYVFYNQLKIYDENDTLDRDIMLCTFAAAFSMFSMKYWGFSRIGLYFAPAQVMLIPRNANAFNTKGSKAISIILIIILFYAYMVSLLYHGEAQLVPYQTVFGVEFTGDWHDYDF